MRRGSAAALVALLLAPPGQARAATAPLVLKVAPEGAAVGARLPSLAQALDRVAALRRQGEARPIVVELDPGTHRLARAVRIGPEHSAAAPLTLRGAAGGGARLVGSVPLPPAPLPPALKVRLPEAARAAVRAFRLPDSLARLPAFRDVRHLRDEAPRVTEIYDRRGALRPARWPNEGYARLDPVGRTGFTVREGPPRPAVPEPELWADAFFRWDWLNETLPVTGPEAGTHRFTLAETPFDGIGQGGRVRLVHALSQLDQPGEWWRDRASGLLLAWPAPDAPDLEAGLAESLIVAEGVHRLRIERLRLERARGDLVVVRGGADVEIRASELAWAGGRAAVFEDVAGGGVAGSTIHDIGATGVRLVGGDRATLLPGGLFLRDTRLTRFARLTRTQNAAAQVGGVGAEVSGNYIHDAVGYAVHFRGNDHLFARNEVARLMHGLSDSGAIYAGRDWTARGTVIRDNYVHGIATVGGSEVKGVYLDDMASGFRIERNLFVGVQQPVFIGGGSDNVVSGNAFVVSDPAISLDSRGETWMAASVTDPESEIRAAYAAVPVASPVWRRRFPRLEGLLRDEPKVARDNRFDGNLVLNGRWLVTYQQGDPRRQTFLLNTEARDDALPRAAQDPDAVARLLARHGFPSGMSPEAMRRDRLPQDPARTPLP